jgi:hypothetical protein
MAPRSLRRSAPLLPGLRTALAALSILAIAAVPVSLYLGQQLAARRLGGALSRGLGLPVSVEGFWGGAGPSIVIAGLTVGGKHPILRVERTQIDFELRASLRPAVRRVRLLRPTLQVSDGRLWRWLRQQQPDPSALRASPRRTATPAPRRRSGAGVRNALTGSPEVQIDEGTLRVEHVWHGHHLALRSSGISLRPGSSLRASPPRTARLLLGGTQLHRDGQLLFEAAAISVELDRRHGWRPLRGALLGGSVRPPGGEPLTLHAVKLVPDGNGAGYRLQATAKPAGQDSGRIVCSGALDRSLRPAPPDGLELSFRQVAVGRLTTALDSLGLRLQRSRLSGQTRLVFEEGLLRIQANLSVDEVQIQQSAIARRPVGPFAAELEGTALVDPEHGDVRLEDLRVATGDLSLALRGQASLEAGHTHVSLDARLPATPCQKVLAALPPGLAPSLAGMALSGELGLRARLRLDTADLEATEADLLPDPLTCKVLADPPRANVRKLLGPVAIRVTGGHGDGRDWLLGPKNPSYRPLARISSALREAFVVAEDSKFWSHRGFDLTQLRRAFINNLKEGRLGRGASTISQQLIKNVYLGQERTLARKLQEAVLTWRLEQVVPKRRILELYLNLVEMGPDVYGVGQAARTYFKEDASHLGPVEAAKLAALTPSPRHLAPRLRDGNPGEAMKERVQTLLRLMRRRASHPTAPALPPGEQVSLLPDSDR